MSLICRQIALFMSQFFHVPCNAHNQPTDRLLSLDLACTLFQVLFSCVFQDVSCEDGSDILSAGHLLLAKQNIGLCLSWRRLVDRSSSDFLKCNISNMIWSLKFVNVIYSRNPFLKESFLLLSPCVVCRAVRCSRHPSGFLCVCRRRLPWRLASVRLFIFQVVPVPFPQV